jgi:hypothetical protein
MFLKMYSVSENVWIDHNSVLIFNFPRKSRAYSLVHAPSFGNHNLNVTRDLPPPLFFDDFAHPMVISWQTDSFHLQHSRNFASSIQC